MSDQSRKEKDAPADVYPSPEVEEILKQVDAPPDIKSVIKESVSLFMAERRPPPTIPVEELKAMTEYLTKDSNNQRSER